MKTVALLAVLVLTSYSDCNAPIQTPRFVVSCQDSECAVVYQNKFGSRTTITEGLSPADAQNLASQFNTVLNGGSTK